MAGTSTDNIHLYYELTEISVVANAHSIHLVLNIPLQTANRHFTLFRIITLPVRVTSDKFVQYSVEFTYFGLQSRQQTYLLLSETAFSRKKGNIVICPADIAVYDAQTLTCESSLSFKTGSTRPLCRRTLLVHHSTPSLKRYGTQWIFHFTRPHQVTLRCAKTDTEVPCTLMLDGTGLLHNATGCHISSPELQAFPELHGTTYAKLDAPMFYLPDNISVLDDHEFRQIQGLSLPNLQ